jgi:hypothetical protein
MPDFEPIPYRIRIGVTGHRKLDDPPAVQALVMSALDSEIEMLFSVESTRKIKRVREAGTTAISFRILSPLAEGADRVVATAVLAEPDDMCTTHECGQVAIVDDPPNQVLGCALPGKTVADLHLSEAQVIDGHYDDKFLSMVLAEMIPKLPVGDRSTDLDEHPRVASRRCET